MQVEEVITGKDRETMGKPAMWIELPGPLATGRDEGQVARYRLEISQTFVGGAWRGQGLDRGWGFPDFSDFPQ